MKIRTKIHPKNIVPPRSQHLQDFDLSQFTADNDAAARFSWCSSAMQAILAMPELPEVFPQRNRGWWWAIKEVQKW
jgi:hypothetical protein